MEIPVTETEDDFLQMPREVFVERFTAELLRLVGPTYFDEDDPEPHSTAEYAAETAPTYHDDASQRAEGPEECARADHSYWGD